MPEITSVGPELHQPQPLRASLRRQLRESGAPYLATLFVTVVLAQFAQYLSPSQVLLKGQPAAVVIYFAGFGVSFVLWWLYRPRDCWPPVFDWLVGAWALLWAVTVGLSVLHGDLFNLTAILVLPSIAMIWLKRASFSSCFIAGDSFAVALVAVAIASQLLDFGDIKALHYEGWNRWPLLTDITGPIGRWEGPFGNVNYAGPIGSFLVVFGLMRPGGRRVLFVAAGGVIILMSDSRTAILSCAVGIAVLIAVAPKLGAIRTPLFLRIAAPLAVCIAFAGYVLVIDPTLNLRTPVWEVFLSQWTTSPVTGVGASGIQDQIDGGTLQAWANHGHNLVIDALMRYGALGVAALAGVVIATGVIATKAARVGFAASAVILATSLADGISEDLVDWRYLGVQAMPLMLAGLLGAAWLTQVRREKKT